MSAPPGPFLLSRDRIVRPLSHDKDLRSTAVTHHLVGVHEIANLLGVSRQRVDEITRTHADFPEPEAVLASGRVWKREDVEAWARRTGRMRRP